MDCEICINEPNLLHQHNVSCVCCGETKIISVSKAAQDNIPNFWYLAKHMDNGRTWVLCSTKCALAWASDKHQIKFERKIAQNVQSDG